jgi:methyl-accepting chemotaxis protein
MTKKSKTMKKKNINKQKNKNKKILEKLVNDSILEENIQILIGGEKKNNPEKTQLGGNSNLVYPSEFDKLLGYETPVDTTSTLDKLKNYVTNSVSTISNISSGLIARKVSDTVGMEGKNPEEIAETLKKDTEKLEKINDYLKTNDGKKMVGELKQLTTTASDVIGEAVQKIPEDLDETMDKLAENAVNAGVGAMTDIPGVNVVVGTSKMVSSLQGVAGETAEAVGKVANLVGDTAEKIEEPINDIKDKIGEISDKIKTVENFSQEIPQTLKTPQLEISQTHQSGGYDMNNIHNNIRNNIQNGGKKIRKRVNNTRHAFKNLVKNITRKNK